MRTLKFIFILAFGLASSLLFKGCQDLDVTNTNEPTREAVLGDVNNTLKLLRGGYQDVTGAAVDHWAMHVQFLSDQRTTTNAYQSYWDFSEEPRMRLNNTTAFSAEPAIGMYWGDLNSGVATANQFIDLIENEGETFVSDGTDLTNNILAQAYFLRGLARGYLGLIYDQAYLLEAGQDLEDPEFKPYEELISNAISDIDRAISAATDAPSFQFSSMPNTDDSWSRDQFLDIANSYAARFLAGQARTPEERDQLDWTTIGNYADAGLGGPNAQSTLTDFTASNVGSSGAYSNNMADALNWLVTCGGTLDSCSGYNPTDIMQIHLLDPSYPTEYPAEHAGSAEASLEPAESDDPRIGYFVYTTNPGFLDNTRNPNLFSNYFSLRYYAANDWWPSSYGVHLFTSVENDLLRAEAHLMQNQSSQVAQILNSSTAGDSSIELTTDLPAVQMGYMESNGMAGGYSYSGTESIAEIQWALLREYSVELELLGGVGIQWFYMRRHDLLQEGTPTMFPVPGEELEITGRENYTFGGADYAGEVGSAAGDNSWKELAEKAFDSSTLSASKAKVNASGETYLPLMDTGITVPYRTGKQVSTQ